MPSGSGPAAGTEEAAIRIGCAGWALGKSLQGLFPPQGTHLERYAALFPTVEINSSFYRPHKRSTYVRWAESVGEGFRFCVKAPRQITHVRRLADCGSEWEPFLDQVSGLGRKLGPLLIQLPPSLPWDRDKCAGFFADLRGRYEGAVALEPRHASWFTDAAAAQAMERFRLVRVAADPAVTPAAGRPGGWNGFAYHRLHGHPKMYYSKYPEGFLKGLSETLTGEADRLNAREANRLNAGEAGGGDAYCIFDNTAEGHAIPDALALMRLAPISS